MKLSVAAALSALFNICKESQHPAHHSPSYPTRLQSCWPLTPPPSGAARSSACPSPWSNRWTRRPSWAAAAGAAPSCAQTARWTWVSGQMGAVVEGRGECCEEKDADLNRP